MRSTKGFTLIELLIVVVIIGILAAIAIPKFAATREKAYFAAMKSDIKNLATQQEIYYADYYSYTTSVTDLGYVESDGVNVGMTASTSGWSGSATHDAYGTTTDGCSLYFGNAAATTLGSPTAAGEVACTQ